jgi:hypothetical protein
MGEVGSWEGSVGVGYESTDDLRNGFSEGTVEDVNGGDGGAPGTKDGITGGMLLILGFGCANGPEEGVGSM